MLRTIWKGITLLLLILLIGFGIRNMREIAGLPRLDVDITVNKNDATKTVTPFSVAITDGRLAYQANNNRPSFTDEEKEKRTSFVSYGKPDTPYHLAPITACVQASVNHLREQPSADSPGLTHEVRNDEPIYTVCFLLDTLFGGANETQNLFTGTTYFYENAWRPYMEALGTYLTESGNHVLLRVTPEYAKDTDVIPSWILLEAWSCEDQGTDISFCIRMANYAPGLEINYETGTVKRTNRD